MRADTLFLSILALPLSVLSTSHVKSPKSHNHALKRAWDGSEISAQNSTRLAGRDTGVEFTWFVTGLGACGNTNSPSDYIVAMGIEQFGNGEHCGQSITITIGGKTAVAQIQDKCQKCAYGALDFTEGLFEHFGSKDGGTLYGDWYYGTGPTTTTTQQPTPSSTYSPPSPSSTTTTTTSSSSSTWVAPSSSSSSTPEPTPSSSSSATPSSTRVSSSSWSSSSSALSTSSSAAPISTPSTTDSAVVAVQTQAGAEGENLSNFNVLILQMAGLVVKGAAT